MAIKLKINIDKKDFKEDFMVDAVETKPVHFRLEKEDYKELAALALRMKYPKPGRVAKRMILGWLATQKG